MPIAAANETLLRRRWPELWAALAGAPRPARVEVAEGTPEATLVVDGLHLTSAYDRGAEARLQASLVPADAREAWVYGLALGDLPRALLARPALERLHVVLMSGGVAAEALARFDQSDWLSDPRVELSLAEPGAAPLRPFAVAPALLRLAEDRALGLRDGLILELAGPFLARSYEELEADLLAAVEANRPLLGVDGDVRSLFGASPGGRVIVAGGGPTLADQLGWIARRPAGVPLVAVSTALAPLLGAGAVPDVVVAVEHRPGVERHLEGVDLERLASTSLVYLPTLSRPFVDRWPGRRLVAYADRPRFRVLAEEHPKGVLFSSGTVLHLAVDLAVRMGAAEVVLAGADFCFPGGESHAPGAAQYRRVEASRSGHTVLNGLGERVQTDTNMIGYLRDLERYIASTRGVRFVNTGRRGAAIEGAPFREPESE